MPVEEDGASHVPSGEELNRLMGQLRLVALEVCRGLGPGLNRWAYGSALVLEFRARSMPVAREMTSEMCMHLIQSFGSDKIWPRRGRA